MNFPLNMVEETHSLLEPTTPAYSNVTVRRAFVVWMYCGQRNNFKDVCNYYHHLEAMEDRMTPERRASSRNLEFDLFTNQPPTSTYLMDHFPNLYAESFIAKPQPTEETNAEKYDFKLEDLTEITPKNGVTTQEIVETSRLIRKYCRMQAITLKSFLDEFKEHAKKCELKYTVNNVAFYIKRKIVQAEIKLEANYPKTLGFLNSKSFDDSGSAVGSPNKDIKYNGNTTNGNSHANVIVKDLKPVQIFNGNRNGEGSKIDQNAASANVNSINKQKARSMKEAFEGVYPQIIDNQNNGGPAEREFFLNGHSTPKEDLNDVEDFDLLPTKERRFSGSFEKIQLVKFRKI